jgi:RNA polymerase sigma factor (sigma-70 family)
VSSPASVTTWIGQLKSGNHDAAQQLWNRYFPEMVRLARARLHGFPRRAVDEEDVAVSAFNSFCEGAAAGRFPLLSDRNNLWRLLVVITARKAIDARQREARQIRGGGKVRGESAWANAPDEADQDAGIQQVIGAEPTPEFAAQVAEQTRRLLDVLDSDELRTVAVCKMEGYSNREIAEKLGVVERTVERKLDRIRKFWEAMP